MWHEGCLIRQQDMELYGNLLALLGGYLQDCSLKVIIQGKKSRNQIGADIPDGSELGSFLQNILSNELLNVVREVSIRVTAQLPSLISMCNPCYTRSTKA